MFLFHIGNFFRHNYLPLFLVRKPAKWITNNNVVRADHKGSTINHLGGGRGAKRKKKKFVRRVAGKKKYVFPGEGPPRFLFSRFPPPPDH